MEASNVYYTDFRCPVGTSLLEKLRRLCLAAGIRQLDMEGKFVAIKMHFGELGNLAFLRPNYAKVVADLVQGARAACPSSPTATPSIPAAGKTRWSIWTRAYAQRLLPR